MNDLEDLKITGLINAQHREHGIDSLDACKDPAHFRNFPYTVSYRYNSRGFRDAEWPEDLSRSIWCLGDSFTVGLGSPWTHTWPQVLSQHSGQRVINISMNGASNQWIQRRALQIIRAVKPRNVVVMWSYLHRREHSDATLDDQDRRVYSGEFSTNSEDLNMFCAQVQSLNDTGLNVVHTAVPFFRPGHLTIPLDLGILEFKSLDLARDGFHFDIATSNWLATQLTPRLVL